MSPFSLEGKLIVMTEASSGTGRQYTVDCSKMEASVILITRDEERLKGTVSMMEHLERRSCCLMDLFQIDQVRPLADNIVSTRGKIDAYTHTAEIGKTLPLGLLSLDGYKSVFTVNMLSAFEFMRYFSSRENFNDGGRVILILSILSIVRRGRISAYAASEGAMAGAIKSMALEFTPRRICINSISPGTIGAPLMGRFLSPPSEENYKQRASRSPLGLDEVTGTPRACLFLLSDTSR